MEAETTTTIVVVPFTAQGHLNQALHLSLRLASRGFSVHFASTESHNRQAKDRLQGWKKSSLQNVIRFHDLHAPPYPSPPPDPNSTTKFPSHLIPSYYASLELRTPIASLLRSLSTNCRRLVLIHDPLMSFAASEAAHISNAESYRLQCVPPFFELSHYLDPNPNSVLDINQAALDVIFSQFDGTLTDEILAYLSRVSMEPIETGTLFNACRAIEGDFFHLLTKIPRYHGKFLFAVGPLCPTAVVERGGQHHQCLEWLDKQPEDSVVYVSFGSSVTLSDEQIKQLAMGLKSSGQRFIWGLRDADRGDNYADGDGDKFTFQRELPPGFEQDMENVGMVVRGWAPQLHVLAHRSTGAFMSHCGWNSCMESLSMGVPMIAWPMHSDQPRNAKMVTDYLKAGITVRDWSRHKEVVSGGEIREVIKRMMVSDEGAEIRERAKSIGEEARLAVSEGGSSEADLDSFIAHITR